MATKEIEAAREQYRAAEAERSRIGDAYHHATLAAKAAELALLEAVGMGASANADWIRAWLDGRHTDCDRIVESEQYASERDAYFREVLRVTLGPASRAAMGHPERLSLGTTVDCNECGAPLPVPVHECHEASRFDADAVVNGG